jgi:hypothetical protein
MIKRIVLILTISLFIHSSCLAGFITGNNLAQWMKDNDGSTTHDRGTNYQNAAWFFGYVIGVADVGNNLLFKIPQNATAGQLCAIVSKHLKENPEKWAMPADWLVVEALAKAFPMKKKE